MKVAIKFTANIKMDVIKEYMEELGGEDETPREFLADWAKDWGLAGLNQSTLSSLGKSIFSEYEWWNDPQFSNYSNPVREKIIDAN